MGFEEEGGGTLEGDSHIISWLKDKGKVGTAPASIDLPVISILPVG